MGFIEKSFEFRKNARRLILGWVKPEILVAESVRKELNASLQQHWPDNPIQVHELIVESWEAHQQNGQATGATDTRNFIVFIDAELDVDWINDGTLTGKAAECVSFADSIGARRCQHLPREQVLELKRVIGLAIVNGIQGDEEQSWKLAMQAADFLKDRTVERSRVWTLASAHWLLFIFAMATAFLFGLPDAHSLFLEMPSGLWLAAAGGLLGAYLSLIQKAGIGEWDAASGHSIHVLEVFTKLIAGAFFGITAFAISQSAHAPLSIKSLIPDSYSIFLFGLAAGLFERMIPKMVSSYLETTKTNPQENEP